ncbi:hypothetical protein Dimus_021285 [Dionaea muscipula]
MPGSVRRVAHFLNCIVRGDASILPAQRDCLIRCRGCLSSLNPSFLTRLGCFVSSLSGDGFPSCVVSYGNGLRPSISLCGDNTVRLSNVRRISSSSIELKTSGDIVRFSFGNLASDESKGSLSSRAGKRNVKKKKMSRKAKLNELRFYRLKAKKKMRSPNPEVRIRYKLEKAKRKELWLIEKLTKYEVPKAPAETHDPEILTEEERFYLKRTGEKKKNYVPVGRRGVFGGVVLNMHLHWKKHETVKVVCKCCKPGQVHKIAEELTCLSKGVVIDVMPNDTIIFYRGKNYVQPEVMSPPDTLSKDKVTCTLQHIIFFFFLVHD